ncbi:MAG: uroporphyrinogen-III synthase, partial [Alphaproteobacteria bacterium]
GDVRSLALLAGRRLEPSAGVLVHVSGSAVAGDLVGLLAEQGFTVKRAVLYDARPVAALGEEAQAAIRSGDVAGVLFFSPRTAEAFVRLARSAKLVEALGGAVAFCISAAVAESAGAVPWRVVEVAERPEQAALVELVVEECHARQGVAR